jgi:hypothetical protein
MALQCVPKPVSITPSIREKVQCIKWLAEFKSVVTIQCNFSCTYRRQPPNAKVVHHWFTQLKEIGSALTQKVTKKTTSYRRGRLTYKHIRCKETNLLPIKICNLVQFYSKPQLKMCNISSWDYRLKNYKRHMKSKTVIFQRVEYVTFMLNEANKYFVRQLPFTQSSVSHHRPC